MHPKAASSPHWRIATTAAVVLLLSACASQRPDVDDRPPVLESMSDYRPSSDVCETSPDRDVLLGSSGPLPLRQEFRYSGMDLTAFSAMRGYTPSAKARARAVMPARKSFITMGMGFKKFELLGMYHDERKAKFVVDYETKGRLWASYLLGPRYTMGLEEAHHRRGRMWCWINVKF